MMHDDSEVTYGRVGTIDPGDLVVVKAVGGVEDVRTFVEGGDGTYGAPGDVIVYYPGNDRATTPIIHRAMLYVEKLGEGDAARYRVRWNDDASCPTTATRDADGWCAWGSDGITIDMGDALQLSSYAPERGGFVTKGDNPVTNVDVDQLSAPWRDELGERSPIQLSWIEGKARGELPWLGLIKLSLGRQYNQDGCAAGPPEFHFFEESVMAKCRGWVAFGRAWAPVDLWVMLGTSLFALVGVPMLYDFARNRRGRAAAAKDAEAKTEDGEQRL